MLLGNADDFTCSEFICFHMLHGGLYFDDPINVQCVLTVHPACKEFDWKWEEKTGDWTVSSLWSDSKEAMQKTILKAVYENAPIKKICGFRRGKMRLFNADVISKLIF